MRRRPHPEPRRGFTIAELLVALAMLTVGLLALAGNVTSLARAESRAALDARAAALMSERVERIAGAKCADAGGVVVSRGVTEAWRTSTADSVHWLADSVHWLAPGGAAKSSALAAPVRCAP
jgi:prepilin-type N-terminal cleavage/methylation domain-containing protein